MTRKVLAIAALINAFWAIDSVARSPLESGVVSQAAYQRRPFPPVDEAQQDVDFHAFRQTLIQEVIARDVKAVLGAMHSELQSQLSRLALPREAFVGARLDADWERLETLLRLGGSFTSTRGALKGRREFCAPYTYSAYPRPVSHDLAGELDPWVIIGSRVALRAEPAETASVLMWLSPELVKVSGDSRDGGDPNWYGVIAFDGREGWVKSSEIRDPEDYHACFAKIDGRWLITAFDRGLPP